jgi:hypothetical protein
MILFLVLIAAFCFPLMAEEGPSTTWENQGSSTESIYRPNVKKVDMSFLQPLELAGMAAGTYLACRSDIMSNCMNTYKTKMNLWSVISNTGLAAITVFAGTLIGGVSTAVAFGPMDTDFDMIKDMNLSDGTRGTMLVCGALCMAGGAYAGYVAGGKSPQKYGEEMIIGSIAGAIVGSYVGELIGSLIFGKTTQK